MPKRSRLAKPAVICVKAVDKGSVTFLITDLAQKNGEASVVLNNLDAKRLASAKGNIENGSAKVTVPIAIDLKKTPEYVVLYSTPGSEGYSAESFFYLVYGCEAMICGDMDFYAGSSGIIRVIAHHRSTLKPIKNARVTVTIRNKDKNAESVSVGNTNEFGTTEVQIDFAPESAGPAEIMVKVESDIGADIVRKIVTIKSANKILMTTDKPLYQPGQTVHMRMLATSFPGTKPAPGKDILVEIKDPKRNIVFRKKLQTNDFGIAAQDFVVADEVIEGKYTASAVIGDSEYISEFKVERYVLPKFKVNVKLDKESGV